MAFGGMVRRFRLMFVALLALAVVAASGAALADSSLPPTARLRAPSSVADDSPVQQGMASPQQRLMPTVQSPAGSVEYVLGTGDRIHLTVYGEDDLSGEYEIGSTGVVALPLIGNVDAASHTIREFESAVRSRLAEGYLHDPRVSVQVINYRPFFILGEVSKPGSYPYVNGMTVLNAVALAGGYTYRADTDGVVIVHANDSAKKEKAAREDAVVMPGDIIRVPERYF